MFENLWNSNSGDTTTLGDDAQWQLVVGVIASMILLCQAAKKVPPVKFETLGQFLRLLIILLGFFVSVRYLLWRTFNTLPASNPLIFSAGVLLYLAEVYGFAIMLVGAFVTIRPLHRPIVPLSADPAEWPSVDVLVPSYNESEELLEITLLGALNLDYPRDKLDIYLLDDGGTVAKRNQSDPEQAAMAHRRHRRLQALCQRLGVRYLTRERNESAKAGNINSALAHIHGDLVLILDADHVPTADILRDSVGWFERDPRTFLVQTPHFFVNPDPIEKNLKTYEHMPSEQEVFYTNIQRGLDFWNSSFFCGSAAILRRRHLDEVGGVQGVSVTEDAETALALHARGYRSAYIWKPMMAGLQPENFVSLVKQRVRWAQGMTQLMILKNPLRHPGLSWYQRLSYLNCMMFWLFPFARIVFLLAPLSYLLLGSSVYNANLHEMVSYALPHLIGGIILTDYLYGNARWMFVSEFYELLLSLFMIKPLIQVIRSPRSPSFHVTAKGELADQDHISPLAGPLYWMLALVSCGMVAGAWRYFAFPLERDSAVINLVWASFNLGMLLGALGALLERRQQRAAPRVPFVHPATLHAGERTAACVTSDLSVSGVGVLVDLEQAEWSTDHRPERIAIEDGRGR
ncbi:MAG: UDP-forming cellulose synthase catalytic subunit, partial [Candidatus Competibacteraceae bacterium]